MTDGAPQENPYDEENVEGQGKLVQWLAKVAEVGNRLPDPLTFFVLLTMVVVGASVLFDGASAEVIQRSGEVETKTVHSLLSREGIRWMFLSALDNFTGFAPLGPVLAVMIGIGVAERSGFITMGLRMLVGAVPNNMLTATLVFAGVMSSLVADAGYVVLTPLGAVLFAGLGRHPLAGLAAAFAGVSGGYSANLLITGLDPLLASLTHDAAQTIDSTYTVNAAANYYFMIVSTFLVTAVGTVVTSKVVEPMLGEWDPSKAEEGVDDEEPEEPTERERTAFKVAMGVFGVMSAGIAFLGAYPNSPLRQTVAEGAPAVAVLEPFFNSIEVMILLLFIVPGIVYGVVVGKIENDKDVAEMASESMAAMGTYVVLAFVAGQFVAYFEHTHLGSVTAVRGAELLQTIGLKGIPLLIAFMAVSATMNLFVGSASAKWAFMAPIFVPMLMNMGLSPETTQIAYRIGDSTTNIITPLMPYLPIIIVFAQKYDRDAGLGTLIAMMLPYSIAFAIAWTIMMIAWMTLGLPVGPGAELYYQVPG